jgi:hypothetical protein
MRVRIDGCEVTLRRACFYKTNVDKSDLDKHKVRLDWKTGIAVGGLGCCTYNVQLCLNPVDLYL